MGTASWGTEYSDRSSVRVMSQSTSKYSRVWSSIPSSCTSCTVANCTSRLSVSNFVPASFRVNINAWLAESDKPLAFHWPQAGIVTVGNSSRDVCIKAEQALRESVTQWSELMVLELDFHITDSGWLFTMSSSLQIIASALLQLSAYSELCFTFIPFPYLFRVYIHFKGTVRGV